MSWGSLSVAQAQVVRRHVRGRRVHDLGAGNLLLSHQLIELGARRVVAVDMHMDFRVQTPGVDFVCSSFRRFKDPVSVAFVSWPAQYGTRGLTQILSGATKVIYLGLNENMGTVCGGKAFWEAMRKREILHSVECLNNDLFVYGPRRVRREPNAHELRAEARYNWIDGGEERALTHGGKVLRRLLESAAREEDADYEIRRRRNEISKGPRP